MKLKKGDLVKVLLTGWDLPIGLVVEAGYDDYAGTATVTGRPIFYVLMFEESEIYTFYTTDIEKLKKGETCSTITENANQS